MSPVTVSVVIPTYRHRDFIVRTLASVEAQTFGHYEVIVVNDGSPDDTASVLAPFVRSGRIRYIEQPNGGQASARNRGIAEAQGEFIALLDDDDLWPIDKLAWQIAALEANPTAVMVYGRAEYIDADDQKTFPTGPDGTPLILPDETPCGDAHAKFVHKNWIISPGQALIRHSALKELDGGSPFDVDPALRGCDDWDLWARLAEKGAFLFVDRVALRYRFHSMNASRDVIQMHRSTLAMQRKHLERNRRFPERYEVSRQANRAALLWSATELIAQAYDDRKRGEPELALGKLRFLFETQPACLLKPQRIRQIMAAALHVYRHRRQTGEHLAGAASVSSKQRGG